MNAVNLTNRMLKTPVAVSNKPLLTPADRIGTGFMAVAMPSAEFLSLGHFLPPQRSTLEPVSGSQLQEVSAMRYQPTAVKPTGPVGRVSGPNNRRTRLSTTQWQKQANLLGGTPPRANTIRELHSWSYDSISSLDRDCQSPDLATNRTDWKRLTATQCSEASFGGSPTRTATRIPTTER
jgi:hypothetical protein